MKQTTVGVLAHVDAGKTTLCEALLYRAGAIRRLGRVDHRDSLFDSFSLERARGITIFSKQASFTLGDSRITLLDTPGHVDFAAETERVLPVLDCAVLVVSGSDGVQPHTETLWRLLRRYAIPTMVFVTKMDLLSPGRDELLRQLRALMGAACCDCSALPAAPGGGQLPQQLAEELAALDEPLMERYFETGAVTLEDAAALFRRGALLPCFFGSGLKLQGVDALLTALCSLPEAPAALPEFAARVFKITRDAQGTRLSHLRLTGGTLKLRDAVSYTDEKGEPHTEKITGIRLYTGEKYSAAQELSPGMVAAVSGLEFSFAGQSLGAEPAPQQPVLEPVLRYRVLPPADVTPQQLLEKLALLQQEDPLLRAVWQQQSAEVQIQLMGEVQLEVLQSILKERFGLEVRFDQGQVLYRETITRQAEGVGHFEPLRHYAEVHLLLQPLEPGSGLVFDSSLSTDILAANWQRLILYQLEQAAPTGVLGNFPLTDCRITLCAGKAHLKHTEGQDMRQAALRALRQGLLQADSRLLEPVYRYTLTLPTQLVGRALGDIRMMSGSFSVQAREDGTSVLTGTAPVSEMQGYAATVAAYTGGRGRLSCQPEGFAPCHNAEEVLAARGYDPLRDTENPPDSVFCRHGAGFVVPWNEVERYMHLESVLKPRRTAGEQRHSVSLDEEALEHLMEREFGPIRRREYGTPQRMREAEEQAELPARKQVLLVDGYNVIFDWEQLRALAERSLDLARVRLMDLLADYRAFVGCEVVLVFDAYRSQDSAGKRFLHHGIEVLFTESGQTADAYLERLAQEIGKDDMVRVVSNDNLVSIGAVGAGVRRSSCTALAEALARVQKQVDAILQQRRMQPGTRLGDLLDEEELRLWKEKNC